MSGATSKGVNALNTVTDHLDRLEQNWKALDNMGGWGTALNRPANWLAQLRGDPRIKPFLDDQEAVSNELMRAWRQTGAEGEKGDRVDWKKGLDINASPKEQQSSINEMYSLINGKLKALKSQYETGIWDAPRIFGITPEAQTICSAMASSLNSARRELRCKSTSAGATGPKFRFSSRSSAKGWNERCTRRIQNKRRLRRYVIPRRGIKDPIEGRKLDSKNGLASDTAALFHAAAARVISR